MNDYDEIMKRLYARRSHGIRPGLDAEKALLEVFDNPERSFGVIHVAGTNGKGSVCALLAGILQAMGFRTGLYTSPHLIRFGERIRVDDRELSEDDIVDLTRYMEDRVAVVEEELGRGITFFEMATAMAFEHFRNRQVNIAVIETGMGGRLDATNVVEPLISAITPVSIEHALYLGNSIEKIAGEKAGIIKPGAPVVYRRMDAAAETVIRKKAEEAGVNCVCVEDVSSTDIVSREGFGQKVRIETGNRSPGVMNLPLAGEFQAGNLACAVVVVDQLERVLDITIPDKVLKVGVEQSRWQGRFEILAESPPVALDGAHNPSASAALRKAIVARYGKAPVFMVLGMCDDKDAGGFLRQWKGSIARIWCVDVPNERSMDNSALAAIAREKGYDALTSGLDKAFADAVAGANAQAGVVCICGSLFLSGWVIENRDRLFPLSRGEV
ncbi:MAG: bifunctional folylpolyglutamate synthase/dihydrofolate synthase [Verrucomicrobiota bacterium]